MSKTYSQVLKQIDQLKAEAERLRRAEVEGVIERIRDAIEAYGLTAADLGFARAKPGPKPGAKKAAKRAPKKKTKARAKVAGRR